MKFFEKCILLISYFSTKINSKRFKSRKDLDQWQLKKLKQFAKFLKKSPYYISKISNGNLLSLEPIDKKIWMENFDFINTKSIKKEEAEKLAIEAERTRSFDKKINGITVGLSTGTSGNRGIFLASDFERMFWAGNILAKVLDNGLFKQTKIAFFLRSDSNLYQSLGTNKNIDFQFFDLLKTMEEHIPHLSTFNPDIVVAPAKVLKILAKAQQKRSLNIKPKKIISVAEVLDDNDKNFIESIFKLKLAQIYQATEGFLAHTCSEGNLHLNEDLIYFEKEWIDKEHFYPIITDFTRKTQPIVRYRLNDVLKISNNQLCACGSIFTKIEKIVGRSDDILYAKSQSNGELREILPDFIARLVINSSDLIQDFKVVQNNLNHIDINLDLDSDPSLNQIAKLIEENFNQYCSSQGLENFKFTFSNKKINLDLDKKQRRVVRNL